MQQTAKMPAYGSDCGGRDGFRLSQRKPFGKQLASSGVYVRNQKISLKMKFSDQRNIKEIGQHKAQGY